MMHGRGAFLLSNNYTVYMIYMEYKGYLIYLVIFPNKAMKRLC